jgi:hypothetical protein
MHTFQSVIVSISLWLRTLTSESDFVSAPNKGRPLFYLPHFAYRQRVPYKQLAAIRVDISLHLLSRLMSYQVYHFDGPYTTDEATGIRLRLLGLGCSTEQGQPSLQGKLSYAVQVSSAQNAADDIVTSACELETWWNNKTALGQRGAVTMLSGLTQASSQSPKETPPSLFDFASHRSATYKSSNGEFSIVKLGYIE